MVGRIPGLVHAFFRRQAGQAGAVEADAVVVDEVRVFVLVHAVGREVDGLVLLVHVLHLAYVPFAAGNLVEGLPCRAVVQVEVVVVVALARPEDALPVAQVVAVDAGIVDVFLFLLLNQRAYAAVGCRHFEHAVDFVSAFVVLKGDALAVGIPGRSVQVVLVAEEFGRGNQPASAFHFEDAGHLEAQLVAGLGILLLVEFGLELVGGRRLHVVHIPLLGGTDAAGGQCLRVGRPLDVGRIVVALRAVDAQLLFFPAGDVAHVDVVVLDVGGIFPVGRGDRSAAFLVVHLHPVGLWSAGLYVAFRHERVLLDGIGPVFAGRLEAQGIGLRVQAALVQGQVAGIGLLAGLFGQQAGQLLLVEQGRALGLFRVDFDVFLATGRVADVPKDIGAFHPVGYDVTVQHVLCAVFLTEAIRAVIVFHRALRIGGHTQQSSQTEGDEDVFQ